MEDIGKEKGGRRNVSALPCGEFTQYFCCMVGWMGGCVGGGWGGVTCRKSRNRRRRRRTRKSVRGK